MTAWVLWFIGLLVWGLLWAIVAVNLNWGAPLPGFIAGAVYAIVTRVILNWPD